jgi:hypothetical protein
LIWSWLLDHHLSKILVVVRVVRDSWKSPNNCIIVVCVSTRAWRRGTYLAGGRAERLFVWFGRVFVLIDRRGRLRSTESKGDRPIPTCCSTWQTVHGDLTDAEWELIADLVQPWWKPGEMGRPSTVAVILHGVVGL